MIPASYVVIRYIADPARNEPVNVGLVAWHGAERRLAIDQSAVARVIRENPRLHPDALLQFEQVLRDEMALDSGMTDPEHALTRTAGLPILFTEQRRTTLLDDAPAALDDAVERLLDRIVRPRRRTGAYIEAPIKRLERELQPLVTMRRVVPNYLFKQTRSGVPRVVPFFANSGANVAVDVLQLNLKVAEQIRLRADAEANKARDIVEENDVRMVVFAEFSESEDVAEASGEARLILDKAPVELLSDTDALVAELAG